MQHIFLKYVQELYKPSQCGGFEEVPMPGHMVISGKYLRQQMRDLLRKMKLDYQMWFRLYQLRYPVQR